MEINVLCFLIRDTYNDGIGIDDGDDKENDDDYTLGYIINAVKARQGPWNWKQTSIINIWVITDVRNTNVRCLIVRCNWALVNQNVHINIFYSQQ